ncbi:MAG: uncharacterized protein A8A55_2729 [Amphiamblys sp. WSBS2006]|nr:MAG: uncharacterized protein A8A55_2729 [Amphiamblys sp. WSBS2006]
MQPGMKTILRHKKIFFVFTQKGSFLFPEREYNQIRQNKNGYVCLKRKYLPEIANRDTERVICIICHGEAAPEDLVSPLCRQMHFVICKECVEDLQERTDEEDEADETDKREVVCPYCKEKKGDKAYQEEILDALFSLMSRQTLLFLELRPDTEVETVTRLTRETKVVLSNITVTDVLFFKLLSRAVVEIKNRIYLIGHNNTIDWCIGEPCWRTDGQICIHTSWYSDEEMKQIYSSIKTIPGKSIQISAGEIHAREGGICVLLKLLVCIDGYIPDLLLEASERGCIEEILKEENKSIWIGNVKRLGLEGYAVEILPKLMLHKENEIEEIRSGADNLGYITWMLKEENRSVWVGKVKTLKLGKYAVGILPKLRIREENVMEELKLWGADRPEKITEILKEKNRSVWVGKVKRLELVYYMIEILPKLRFHEENVIEELRLDAFFPVYLTGILKTKRNSIWVGKVKKLNLGGYAVGILPKLRIHEENVMKEFRLWIDNPAYTTRVLKEENNSLWIGKVEKLSLGGYAVGILPKLRIHEENVMEKLVLSADNTEHLTETLKTENSSSWVGKVKKIKLKGSTVEILPKLRLNKENEMEELCLSAGSSNHVAEILEMKRKSIWVGRVKKIRLGGHAKGVKDKLDFTMIETESE